MAGVIIAHARHTEVLTVGCQGLDMPLNKSENMIVRSWLPFGTTEAAPNIFNVTSASHITQEGVTPEQDTMVARDVTFTPKQYMCIYGLTDKMTDLYEDDVSKQMKIQTGERMGLVKELAIYGGMKGCTNLFYSGGVSRATVDAKISEVLLQRICRNLGNNHGKIFRPMIAPSVNYGTSSVEASYVAFCSIDCKPDIRLLPGFIQTADYGKRDLISDHEFGTWQDIRFVTSTELKPYADAGAAVGALGLLSTSGSNADVYPVIVMAKEAFAQVKLEKRSDFDPIYVDVKTQDSGDPGGQRGYIGAKFWHTNGVLNNGWMAIGEVAVSSLTD